MNEFVFDRVFSPWDMALSRLNPGQVLPAERFLSLMEQDQSIDPEQAAAELEERGVLLDVTNLPKLTLTGSTGRRLELESKLYRTGQLSGSLDQNDPLALTLEQLNGLQPIADEQALARRAADGDGEAMEALTRGYLPVVLELAEVL